VETAKSYPGGRLEYSRNSARENHFFVNFNAEF